MLRAGRTTPSNICSADPNFFDVFQKPCHVLSRASGRDTSSNDLPTMRSTTTAAARLLDDRLCQSTLTENNVERLRRTRVELYCDEQGLPLWPKDVDAGILGRLDKVLRKPLANCTIPNNTSSSYAPSKHDHGLKLSYSLNFPKEPGSMDDGNVSTDDESCGLLEQECTVPWQCKHCGTLQGSGTLHEPADGSARPSKRPPTPRRLSVSSTSSTSSFDAAGDGTTPVKREKTAARGGRPKKTRPAAVSTTLEVANKPPTARLAWRESLASRSTENLCTHNDRNAPTPRTSKTRTRRAPAQGDGVQRAPSFARPRTAPTTRSAYKLEQGSAHRSTAVWRP